MSRLANNRNTSSRFNIKRKASRLLRTRLSLRKWGPKRIGLLFVTFAMVVSTFASILMPVVSDIAAEPVTCAQNPDSVYCTDTPEKCAAADLYWIESRSTCSSSSPDDCPAVWSDTTLCNAILADTWSLSKKALSAIYIKAIGYCMKTASLAGNLADRSFISAADGKSGQWFVYAPAAVHKTPLGNYLRGAGIDPDDSDLDVRVPCGDAGMKKLIGQAKSLWHLEYDDILCNSSFYRDGTDKADWAICTNEQGGKGSFRLQVDAQTSKDAFIAYIKKKVYGLGPGQSFPNNYTLETRDDNKPFFHEYLSTVFFNACAKGSKPTSGISGNYDADSDTSKIYKIDVVSKDGTKVTNYYNGTQVRSMVIAIGQKDSGSDETVNMKCKTIESEINAYSTDYAIYRGDHPDEESAAEAILGAGTDGCTDSPESCSGGGGTDEPCEVDGALGWIICPAVRFLAGISDGVFTFLADNLLRVDVKMFATGTDNPAYNAWTIMRNVANVAFVIVFLIIIFSQITGAGITNYGVKKMLPRLVIAAILVNLSYFVCQIAVDLSNVLGYSIKGALEGIGANIIQLNEGVGSTNATDPQFVTMTNGVLGSASVLLLLSILLPIMLAGLIAIIVIVFMLIARTAILVMLIVISPLAFVAFLLPNTQGLFTQWRKAFTTLLLMFPIISAVFGLASLTSTIISSVAADNVDGDVGGFINQIIGAGVLILPLFLVPAILKKSLDGIGSIGALMNAAGNKAQAGANAAKSAGKSLAKTGANAGMGRLANTKFGGTRGGRFLGGIASGKGSRGFAAMGKAQEAKQIEALHAQWDRDGTGRSTSALHQKALKHGADSVTGRAAIAKLASKGDADELADIRKKIVRSGSKTALSSFDRSIAGHHSSLKEKNPSAMMDMDQGKWDNMKATETYKMKDAAIRDGIGNGNTGFAQTIMSAATDKLTEENYSPAVRQWAASAQAAKAKGQALPPFPGGGGTTNIPTAGSTNVQAGPAPGGSSPTPGTPPSGGGSSGGAPAGSPVAQGAAQAGVTTYTNSRRASSPAGSPAAAPPTIMQTPSSTASNTTAQNNVTVRVAGSRRTMQVPANSVDPATMTVVGAPQADPTELVIDQSGTPSVSVDQSIVRPNRRASSTDGAFVVNGSGETKAAVNQAPIISAADSQAAARTAAVEAAKQGQALDQNRATTDSTGFQAPAGAADPDAYRDGMNK